MNANTTSPDLGENKIEVEENKIEVEENKIEDDVIVEHEEIEHDELDTFSATSTVCTSCSYMSYNLKINNTQLYIQPMHGHTNECLEHIANSNANIGSISVQNASDVTFGNKTFFNAPVVIKQLVVDYGDQSIASNVIPKQQAKPKQPCSSRILNLFQNRPIMVCSIFTTLAIIVATLILVGYFVDPFGIPSTCEEITSKPSYYDCGYASACTRCEAMFSDKEICQAYYEGSCGDLRCFCKPNCRSTDCR